jgi:hypothetical protein
MILQLNKLLVSVVITFHTCIWEMPELHLDRITTVFPQSLYADVGIVLQIRPQPFHITSNLLVTIVLI